MLMLVTKGIAEAHQIYVNRYSQILQALGCLDNLQREFGIVKEDFSLFQNAVDFFKMFNVEDQDHEQLLTDSREHVSQNGTKQTRDQASALVRFFTEAHDAGKDLACMTQKDIEDVVKEWKGTDKLATVINELMNKHNIDIELRPTKNYGKAKRVIYSPKLCKSIITFFKGNKSKA